jgi:hypothetical protein
MRIYLYLYFKFEHFLHSNILLRYKCCTGLLQLGHLSQYLRPLNLVLVVESSMLFPEIDSLDFNKYSFISLCICLDICSMDILGKLYGLNDFMN